MKKLAYPYVILLLSCILLYGQTVAQSAPPQSYTSADCYNTYLTRGNSYSRTGNYDLAIQQYKAAKYCNKLKPNQIQALDSLIEVTNKKKKAW